MLMHMLSNCEFGPTRSINYLNSQSSNDISILCSICQIYKLFLVLFVLMKQNKVDEARAILAKIYPAEEVDDELKALHESVEFEKAEEGTAGNGMFGKLKGALSNTVVRRGLYAGITVQVAQQFVGINTVMYYSPTIVQFAGFASNQTAMALSLITSGLNVVGTLISMCFVDRYGRRRLMIISMFGIITCLVVLAGVFYYAAANSPKISNLESARFGNNSTCPAYGSASNPASWNCMTCLKQDCAFCSSKVKDVSAQITSEPSLNIN